MNLDEFGRAEVAALAAGATLLGSGGGGDLALGRSVLDAILATTNVPVVASADLPPAARVVHVGVVGSPDVIAERLIDPGDLALAALTAMEGEVPDAIGIIEIGGLNAAAPLMAAAHLGVPVLDGDLMGRAFPSIRQCTLAVAGEPYTPMALVGPGADTVLVKASTEHRVTALLAGTVAALGGACALAMFPTTAQVLGQHGVAGSLSACVDLGAGFLRHRAAHPNELHELATALGGTQLAAGRVAEIVPTSHDTGSITLTDPAAVVRIDFQDEFLALTRDGRTVVATPKVIVVLDRATGLPLRTEQVRPGQAVSVLALPPLHRWPDPAHDVVGPAGFNLDLAVRNG